MKNKPSDAGTLTGVANEFNDALTAIVGFAELAAANPHVRDDAKLALYIDEIRRCGMRGSELLLHWVNQVQTGDAAATNSPPARSPSSRRPSPRRKLGNPRQ